MNNSKIKLLSFKTITIYSLLTLGLIGCNDNDELIPLEKEVSEVLNEETNDAIFEEDLKIIESLPKVEDIAKEENSVNTFAKKPKKRSKRPKRLTITAPNKASKATLNYLVVKKLKELKKIYLSKLPWSFRIYEGKWKGNGLRYYNVLFYKVKFRSSYKKVFNSLKGRFSTPSKNWSQVINVHLKYLNSPAFFRSASSSSNNNRRRPVEAVNVVMGHNGVINSPSFRNQGYNSFIGRLREAVTRGRNRFNHRSGRSYGVTANTNNNDIIELRVTYDDDVTHNAIRYYMRRSNMYIIGVGWREGNRFIYRPFRGEENVFTPLMNEVDGLHPRHPDYNTFIETVVRPLGFATDYDSLLGDGGLYRLTFESDQIAEIGNTGTFQNGNNSFLMRQTIGRVAVLFAEAGRFHDIQRWANNRALGRFGGTLPEHLAFIIRNWGHAGRNIVHHHHTGIHRGLNHYNSITRLLGAVAVILASAL